MTHQQQGVNWITREDLSIATVKLHIKEHVDSDSITHTDIGNILAGRSSPTTELQQLDWQERERDAPIFAKVQTKTRWIQLADVEDAFLKAGGKAEMNEGGFIESRVESVEGGWCKSRFGGLRILKALPVFKAPSIRGPMAPREQQCRSRMLWVSSGHFLG